MVNEFPMMAGLVARNAHVIFCGATIIDKSYAVTAAHCTKKRDVRDVALLVGDHDYRTGSHSPLFAFPQNFYLSSYQAMKRNSLQRTDCRELLFIPVIQLKAKNMTSP